VSDSRPSRVTKRTDGERLSPVGLHLESSDRYLFTEWLGSNIDGNDD